MADFCFGLDILIKRVFGCTMLANWAPISFRQNIFDHDNSSLRGCFTRGPATYNNTIHIHNDMCQLNIHICRLSNIIFLPKHADGKFDRRSLVFLASLLAQLCETHIFK